MEKQEGQKDKEGKNEKGTFSILDELAARGKIVESGDVPYTEEYHGQ